MRTSVVDRLSRRILHLNAIRKFSWGNASGHGSLALIRKDLITALGKRRIIMLTVASLTIAAITGFRLPIVAAAAGYVGFSAVVWGLSRRPNVHRLVFLLATLGDPLFIALLFGLGAPDRLAQLTAFSFLFALLTNTIPILSVLISSLTALNCLAGFLLATTLTGVPAEYIVVGSLMLGLAGYGAFGMIGLLKGAFRHTMRYYGDLKARREQQARSSREKADFLANMNHELRTPLNGIIGMTGLLLSSRLENEQEEYARTIRSSAELLLALINDILDMSRAESGKLQIEQRPFELAPVIALVSDNLKAAARDKGISLNVIYATPMPRLIIGDAARLNQILFNLVGNAIKFTNSGRVSITVSIARRPPDGGCGPGEHLLSLAVADTGVGIPPADLEHIFEKYSQASLDLHHKIGGTGLGLAISRELVHRMNGTIHVASELGKGSVFTALIPCRLPDGEPDGLLASFPHTAAGRHHGACPDASAPAPESQGLILLADDNPVNLNLLGRMIRNFGYRTQETRNGEEALAALRQLPLHNLVDLAILDYQMPLLNGDEVVRQLRQWEDANHIAHVPVIILTGHLGTMLEPIFRSLKDVEIVEKPIRIQQLRVIVDNYRTVRVITHT